MAFHNKNVYPSGLKSIFWVKLKPSHCLGWRLSKVLNKEYFDVL